MPKPTAATLLANRLLEELGALRQRGPDAYPPTLETLTASLDLPPSREAIQKALSTPAFKSQAIATIKDRADAPVALRDDVAALVASERTLEAALRAKSAKAKPPWPPKTVAGVLQKPLQDEFTQSLTKRLADGELPSFVVAVPQKTGPTKIYHRDHPPVSLSHQDAERLVGHLQRRSRQGHAAFLFTVADLLAEMNLKPAAFNKAAKEPVFAQTVLQAKYEPIGQPKQALVFLQDDLERLVTGGELLGRLLSDGSQASGSEALIATELVAKLSTPLKEAMTAFLAREDLVRGLPTDVGFVRMKAGKAGVQRVFFRLDNVKASKSGSRPTAHEPHATPAASAPPAPADFPAAFDAAFTRLDRERGSNNFVSLLDLRAALSEVSREGFDAGVQQLRRERRYWLKSAEGYEGLLPEERAAAIREEGEYLLHASRVRS